MTILSIPNMIKFCLIFLVCFSWPLCILGDIATASERVNCAKIRMISDKKVWFKEAHFEFIDSSDPMKFPFLRADPSFCYQIISFKTFGLRNLRLKDPVGYKAKIRTLGYLDAIEKWIYWKPLDHHPPGWPDGKTIRQRLKDLTNINFPDRKALKKWFEENKYYLYWSFVAEEPLIVVQKAKEEKAHLHYLTFVIGGSEAYWNLRLSGHMDDEWRTDQHIRSESYGNYEDGFLDVAFPFSVLEDAQAKEKSYRKFLEKIIGKLKTHLSEGSFGFRVTNIERLQFVTGQKFERYEDWVKWYEQNKDRLVMSENGQLLIVGKE